ncbi:HNH endonuclease [Tamlana sp. 2201CG12-4]|uniref:HNH endonuclease n=1 Tax=Tamlana sp. 2201CG12-4 TaxID=3112582 RepID=UPI002DBB3E20|nr:HNH endonuclease [Tamlana sp. 2201CG12-4]MEC3908375.1 HNH endonuclease [Tamlana sp. 2201CG12-4]
MKIPKELIPLAYQLSKKVYENSLSLKEAKSLIVGDNKMNSNSAADYINNFRCLIEGKKFTRTLNAFSMEYFFDNIFKDYGLNGLSNALIALQTHIEYYENIQNVKMHKMREIYTKYSSLSIEDIDIYEQNEIIKALNLEEKNRKQIIKELKSLKPTDPEIVTINSKSFKRNNKTIAQIKLLRKFKCQICSTSIKKKDGTLYIEAAHIKPKNKKGHETLDNILLLCPNHHKEFDYGKREILEHTQEMIHFKLNGTEHKIPLLIE